MLVRSLLSLSLLPAAALASDSQAPPGGELAAELAYLALRALPDSPSGNYSPLAVPCPSDRPTIRKPTDLSTDEKQWLELRRNLTVAPMIDFLKRANISGFDAETYINSAASHNISNLPNIAISVSGGGYRALMNGAGFLKAADNRTTNATASGGIGGLLQAATYLSGLSGGGWLVGSLFSNNFSSVEALQASSHVWQFSHSIFKGPEESGLSVLNTADYWKDLADQVDEKSDAGWETTITDYWGRALSYQLVNATDGGPTYTFSSIARTPNFQQGNTPFPLIVSDGRYPNETVVSLNATNYEFNPFEMGSFDPTVYGFVPTRYLGSNFSSGVVPSNGHCVEGFDQVGYVMGTSSTLFNEFLIANVTAITDIPKVVVDAIEDLLNHLGFKQNDIAIYEPNPFYGWNNATNLGHATRELDLVDGGEDGQNIPLTPVVQPVRKVDVVFAVDSSADTDYSWPNGTAIVSTYQRSLSDIGNGTLFPAVPDQNTFVNLGLNYRPTFFGCDATNFTGSGSAGFHPPPLVVYVPNAPYTLESNASTYTMSYETSERDGIILNAYNGATQGNGTLDSQWQTCMGCAIISRSLWRSGTAVPSACTDCFNRYCWNGTTNSTDPGSYHPAFKIEDESLSAKSSAVAAAPAGARLTLAVAFVMAGWLLA